MVEEKNQIKEKSEKLAGAEGKIKEQKDIKEKTEKQKKAEVKEIKKKDKAIINGRNLPISTKQSVAICKFIRGKDIEKAIEELTQVVKLKKAVPMKLEIPHRKGMERGRYPVKASNIFIKLLKSLKANSQVNGIENVYISIAKADIASRPYKRFGSRRFKRTNVLLEARELVKKEKK